MYTIYLATKKDEIMSFAGKYTELEILRLNKIGQVEKHKYHMFSLDRSRGNKTKQKRLPKRGKEIMREMEEDGVGRDDRGRGGWIDQNRLYTCMKRPQ